MQSCQKQYRYRHILVFILLIVSPTCLFYKFQLSYQSFNSETPRELAKIILENGEKDWQLKKTTDNSCRGPHFNSLHPNDGSQISVTIVLR